MKKLYVGNLAYSVVAEDLEQLFGEFNGFDNVKLIMDRETGRSKGFAFAEFSDDAAALDAIEKLNGTDLNGRAINVNEARPQQQRRDNNRRGGFGGGRGRH